jgi:hypothetical protein
MEETIEMRAVERQIHSVYGTVATGIYLPAAVQVGGDTVHSITR